MSMWTGILTERHAIIVSDRGSWSTSGARGPDEDHIRICGGRIAYVVAGDSAVADRHLFDALDKLGTVDAEAVRAVVRDAVEQMRPELVARARAAGHGGQDASLLVAAVDAEGPYLLTVARGILGARPVLVRGAFESRTISRSDLAGAPDLVRGMTDDLRRLSSERKRILYIRSRAARLLGDLLEAGARISGDGNLVIVGRKRMRYFAFSAPEAGGAVPAVEVTSGWRVRPGPFLVAVAAGGLAVAAIAGASSTICGVGGVVLAVAVLSQWRGRRAGRA